MTSISSLLGKMPSLADYLSNNKSNSTSGINGGNSGALSLANYLDSSDSSDGDVISLSAQAQQLLAQGSGASSTASTSADGGKADKTAAADFINKFFTDAGVDTSKLSDEAKKLLTGFKDLTANLGDVSQDTTFDDMTKGYVRGQRQSFTLQGEGERLTAVVQYNNGKPVSLTVTDLKGQSASTAAITLATDDAGKLSSIEIARTEKKYGSFGNLLGSSVADPLSLSLYA